ncbi:hypothetical protein D9M69_483490 [compost metagenome]
MVHFVADHDAVRNAAEQTLQCGVVRSKSGGEYESGFLAMPFGQASFEAGIELVRATDIARPTGARPIGFHGLVHPLPHHGVLGHAEVIVAAPDHYRLIRMPLEPRKRVSTADAAQGREGAVLIGVLQ